jgi:hypothetical protein
MALTTTTCSGAVATGANRITVAAYTRPAGLRGNPIGQFALNGEQVRIVDDTQSPTLTVVRGYNGTAAVPHNINEGFTYGLQGDFTQGVPGPAQNQPVVSSAVQAITVTGTTGSTAAIVTTPSPAFLTLTGAASSGVNLPVPRVGDQYAVKNLAAGAVLVYCLSGSIFATGSITGATGYSISNTGSLGALFFCVSAGVWQVAPLIT